MTRLCSTPPRLPDHVRRLVVLTSACCLMLAVAGCGGGGSDSGPDGSPDDDDGGGGLLSPPSETGTLSGNVSGSPWGIPTDISVVYNASIVDNGVSLAAEDETGDVTNGYLFRRYSTISSPIDGQDVVAIEDAFVEEGDYDGSLQYAVSSELALSDNGWVYARSVLYQIDGNIPPVVVVPWQGVLPPTDAADTQYVGQSSVTMMPAGALEIVDDDAVDPIGRSRTVLIEEIEDLAGGAQVQVYWRSGSGVTSYSSTNPGGELSYQMRMSPPAVEVLGDG